MAPAAAPGAHAAGPAQARSPGPHEPGREGPCFRDEDTEAFVQAGFGAAQTLVKAPAAAWLVTARPAHVGPWCLQPCSLLGSPQGCSSPCTSPRCEVQGPRPASAPSARSGQLLEAPMTSQARATVGLLPWCGPETGTSSGGQRGFRRGPSSRAQLAGPRLDGPVPYITSIHDGHHQAEVCLGLECVGQRDNEPAVHFGQDGLLDHGALEGRGGSVPGFGWRGPGHLHQ